MQCLFDQLPFILFYHSERKLQPLIVLPAHIEALMSRKRHRIEVMRVSRRKGPRRPLSASRGCVRRVRVDASCESCQNFLERAVVVLVGNLLFGLLVTRKLLPLLKANLLPKALTLLC